MRRRKAKVHVYMNVKRNTFQKLDTACQDSVFKLVYYVLLNIQSN